MGRHLAQNRSGNYLDIACGTGNYTAILAQDGGAWIRIELSSKMLTEASGKSSQVQWCLLTATPVQMQSYWLNEYFPDAMLKSIE